MAFTGSLSGYEHNALFLNVGGQARRVEAGYPLGLDLDEDGRAVLAFDPDGDGDLDLVVLSLQGLRYFENHRPAGRHVARVRLRATRSEPHALGAQVVLTAGGHAQLDRARLTAGFHTQVSPDLHFGLGPAALVDSVEVRWPSGAVQRFTGLPVDRRLILTEGQPEARVESLRPWPPEARPRAAGRFSLAAHVLDEAGRSVPLQEALVPTVVSFWGPSCGACARELPALAALARSLGAAVRFLAVNVEPEDAAAVRAFRAKTDMEGLSLRTATDEAVRGFFGSSGEVALPTTFVFGADGRLLRRFRRAVEGPELAPLLRELAALRPTADDYWEVASRVGERGQMARALRLMREAIERFPADARLRRRMAQLHLDDHQPEAARRALEGAVRADPQDAASWADLAKVRLLRGDRRGARVALRHAQALDPTAVRVLTTAGVLAARDGRREAARALLDAALRVDPYFVDARRARARLGGQGR